MSPITQEPLSIQDLDGPRPGLRILRLQGPVVLSTLFQFQSTLRAKTTAALIIDFTDVPYVDSAGIGALVGAYVSHNKDGRFLALVGVNQRVRHALEVTRVLQFFRFFDTQAEAEQAQPS
jgi:anti-sigma B factor antagonist